MAELLVDDLGRPIPQYLNEAGTAFESVRGVSGALKDRSDDGAHVTLGTTTDAASTAGGDGSVSAKLKRLTIDLDALNTLIGAISSTAVTDPALSGALNALLKGILTDLGQTTDLVVAAGADGSISAKLKRLTTDLDALNTKTATLATEATLAAQLDLTLSALRDALAGVTPATVGNLGLILDQLDVALSTRATEATLSTLVSKDFATQTTLATLLADATFTGRVGEVQDVPTANTILGRLKALSTVITDGSQASQLYSARTSGVLHRNAVTSVDKLADFGDADVTVADNGSGTGSLLDDTTYYVTAIPGNRWGNCKVNSNIDSVSTAASGFDTHSIRVTIAQRIGADYYDLFLSTDAAPKWVARITEAQRAAGDYEVTAVGTVSAGGGNPAGTVDVNVAGSGIQTSSTMFAHNNAYTPTTVSSISCVGKTKAILLVKVSLDDLRSEPALSIIPFFANQSSTSDWHAGTLLPVALIGGLGQPLEQMLEIDVSGATGLVVLVDSVAGQGGAVSIWVELV